MCVCMYVCVYVCVGERMYVCVHIYVHLHAYECKQVELKRIVRIQSLSPHFYNVAETGHVTKTN